jgi:hypothetical protein
LGEPRHLLRGEIRRYVLRVRIEQQKQVFSNRPVVNDAGTLALAARSKPYANLADAAATLDESAKIWIRCQPGLKRPYSSSLSSAVIYLVKVDVSISSTCFKYPPLADSGQGEQRQVGMIVPRSPCGRVGMIKKVGSFSSYVWSMLSALLGQESASRCLHD